MTDVSAGVMQAELGDRYTVERELGRGGMGTVYLARDLKLDRLVALKVRPEEFAADPALRERFLRETRTAASARSCASCRTSGTRWPTRTGARRCAATSSLTTSCWSRRPGARCSWTSGSRG